MELSGVMVVAGIVIDFVITIVDPVGSTVVDNLGDGAGMELSGCCFMVVDVIVIDFVTIVVMVEAEVIAVVKCKYHQNYQYYYYRVSIYSINVTR